MLSIGLLLLLTSTQYTNVQAAARLQPRQGPVALWSPCNYPSQGINGPLPCASGSCICKDSTYSQCRTQDPATGSWTNDLSWQCQAPGQSPTGGTIASTGGGTPQSGAGSTDPNAGTGKGTNPNAGSGGGTTTPATSGQGGTTGSGDTTPATSGQGGSTGGGGGSSTGATQPATSGTCSTTPVLSGWTGVASTSNYVFTDPATACDCNSSATWQWSGVGNGYYNGAVNAHFFMGANGQPNCGKGCGSCYQLMSSGQNFYGGGPGGDGIGSGSMMTLNIIDSCYASDGSSKWCTSLDPSATDQAGCNVHFDIMTGGLGAGMSDPTGSDGKAWDSPIVYYREVACDPTFTSNFQQCTCGQRGRV